VGGGEESGLLCLKLREGEKKEEKCCRSYRKKPRSSHWVERETGRKERKVLLGRTFPGKRREGGCHIRRQREKEVCASGKRRTIARRIKKRKIKTQHCFVVRRHAVGRGGGGGGGEKNGGS